MIPAQAVQRSYTFLIVPARATHLWLSRLARTVLRPHARIMARHTELTFTAIMATIMAIMGIITDTTDTEITDNFPLDRV